VADGIGVGLEVAVVWGLAVKGVLPGAGKGAGRLERADPTVTAGALHPGRVEFIQALATGASVPIDLLPKAGNLALEVGWPHGVRGEDRLLHAVPGLGQRAPGAALDVELLQLFVLDDQRVKGLVALARNQDEHPRFLLGRGELGPLLFAEADLLRTERKIASHRRR
jgi:hypothetical protein